MAYLGNFLQLFLRIKCSVLCRMGNINHSRKYHMIIVCVRLEILQIFLQIRRINLPIFFRKLQHLMPGVLDRPGFMNTHVPCLRCHYALIRCKNAADHDRIRLGTAHQKINLRLRASGRLLYFSGPCHIPADSPGSSPPASEVSPRRRPLYNRLQMKAS